VTLLSLRAGRLAVELAPAAGGSITRFAIDGVDVLRPASPDTPSSGRGNEASSYPLVPFSNRIANGRLAFGGREIVLEPNWPGVRHPMHGDGWSATWRVERSDAVSAELLYEHDGRRGWPFRYRARQTFRLTEDTLSVGMAIENLEPHAVPAGLGLHPFFMRDADVLLACRTRQVWLADEEVLPTRPVAVPPHWDFAHGSSVEAAAPLDNCFEGWDGRAAITWPGRKLRLQLEASDLFRCLVIFVPPDKPFFCVEPVSHVNGQVTKTRLAAGAKRSGEIVFRISSP
jgi:aldose 1-epimerase